jgi:hypothetical protein
MSTVETPPPAEKAEKFVDRWYYPRIWDGLGIGTWARLLLRNRFAVHPHRWSASVVVTLLAPAHSLLRLVQSAVYGRRIARTELAAPPLFILGHWRSGTTFLHELLVLDPRHASPTTYECFVPHHFLLTEGLVNRWFSWVMPPRRPMDTMAMGWDRPQEDEFALCNLGQPSPYLAIAFPNRPSPESEELTLDGLSEQERDVWKRTLDRFLRQVTCRNPGKRIVLKSPPHTARVRTLLEAFPEARFVHIVRHPFALFQSTVKLWKSLYEVHGLQVPNCIGLEDLVYENLSRMYAAFERDRGLIGPSRFREVRYEDLVREPISQVRAIYEHLGLGGFDDVLPALEQHLAGVSGHRADRYRLSPELKAEIARRWRPYFERYGYAVEE